MRLIYWRLMVLLWVGLLSGSLTASATVSLQNQDEISSPPRDTVPTFRYDLGFATGYNEITTASQDTERFVSLNLLPEFYYGEFGFGLLGRLNVQPRSATIRDEDFNSARDYLALIYFIQYGQEDDPEGHARFGMLEEVHFGYGHFVDRYTNETRLDDPMRGISGSVRVNQFRFEGLFNDFASPGVFGTHAAYFPLGTDPDSRLPRVQVGFSIAGDLEDDGSQVNPVQPGQPFLLRAPPTGEPVDVAVGADDGPLFMVGVDAGIRFLRTEALSLVSFAEASKILDYGIGASLGVRGSSEVGPLEIQGQYVQRFLGSEFLPDYFDSSYEAQRIRTVTLPSSEGESISAVNTKRNRLRGRSSPAYGYQMRAEVDYEDTFETTVGYETIWGINGGDQFTLDFELNTPLVPVSVRLGYDRFNMNDWTDIFVPTNEDALYRLGIAYEIIGPLRLGVDVRQTYEPVYAGGRAVGQTKKNRFEPFIQLVFRY